MFWVFSRLSFFLGAADRHYPFVVLLLIRLARRAFIIHDPYIDLVTGWPATILSLMSHLVLHVHLVPILHPSTQILYLVIHGIVLAIFLCATHVRTMMHILSSVNRYIEYRKGRGGGFRSSLSSRCFKLWIVCATEASSVLISIGMSITIE